MTQPPTYSRPSSPPRRGMTLPELVLSLAITSIIGLGIVGLLYAGGYGSTTQHSAQDLMVAAETQGSRMADAVQRSHMVLAKGSNHLVLWTADLNGDQAPQLSELRRIEYDATAKTLTSYQPPSNLGQDYTYSLAKTDFNAVTNSLKGTNSMPAQVWGTASAFTVNSAAGTVQDINYLQWQITVTASGESYTTIGGGALRNY